MNNPNLMSWTPDKCQEAVINAHGGYHLVLASPGCGKTQILAERLRRAHNAGIAFSDMLCLTFTNRAARGMVERINENIDDEDTEDIYVGNVHRFCSRFLFSNNIIAAGSSVIDEDDAVSILARFLDEDEYRVAADYRRRREYSTVFHFANFIHQIRHNHPKNLRIHPECVTADDIAALKKICQVERRDFTAAMMLSVYDNTDYYRDAVRTDDYDYGSQRIIGTLLRKMALANNYTQYKRRNRLLDFQDLLMFTYDALEADKTGEFKRYPWIQVDEVQDLNPLQMAIIDRLTSDNFDTVMYLGDEQQAIFSFMGAKLDTLGMLRKRCGANVHHLSVNHRSPDYLLNVFNTYAAEVLDIDRDLLPVSPRKSVRHGNELGIICSDNFDSEISDVAQFAGTLYNNYPDQTTAIIVNANADAELISEQLRQMGISHFKVSGTDLLSSPEVKLLFAHLSVLNNGCDFIAWARLLKGLGVYESAAAARKFVRELFDRAITPSDLIVYERSTYVEEFAKAFDTEEIVVFDTETTGLNVFEDDILQIAAVRMRGGKVVPGSEFCVFITTDRPIPRKLGDIDNPIIEERKHHTLVDHEEALARFAEYVGSRTLLGHNADYDYNILRNNIARYCPSMDFAKSFPRYFDTLKLTRLLEPDLKEYKLKYLLAVLGLEGQNSHLADDDVNATCNVAIHCHLKAKEAEQEQRRFLDDSRVASRASALRRAYSELYTKGCQRLYSYDPDSHPALVKELERFYSSLVAGRTIEPIDNIAYITAYLSDDLVCAQEEPCLAMQTGNHIMEISTLKEADLCNSKSMSDRIFVTTIHKAKGLEFDNVIVFDAVDGRIPNFYNRENPRMLAEDARKFYVAISRAKRRLFVSQSLWRTDYHNQKHPQHLSRFMKPLMPFFEPAQGKASSD